MIPKIEKKIVKSEVPSFQRLAEALTLAPSVVLPDVPFWSHAAVYTKSCGFSAHFIARCDHYDTHVYGGCLFVTRGMLSCICKITALLLQNYWLLFFPNKSIQCLYLAPSSDQHCPACTLPATVTQRQVVRQAAASEAWGAGLPVCPNGRKLYLFIHTTHFRKHG